MVKRIICLLFLMLFITGCDATYNITINKATIIEDLSIYETDVSKWNSELELFSMSYKDVIESNLNYKLGVFFDEQLGDNETDNPNYTFYGPKKINKKDKLGISYNHRFERENYNRAYFPNNCFDKIKVYDDKGYLTISTSKGFNCIKEEYDLSNLTINIKTKYHVETSNADNVNGKTHTWYINKTNSNDKNIYIKINSQKLSKAKENDNQNTENIKLFLTFGVSLALLLIIVIIFLVNKKRKLEND